MPKSKFLNNIFNIKSNSNFLLSLAKWVLEQYPDKFYLANVTILLPSRRACRQLKKVFLELSENQAIILPKILAIGDVDYDEMALFDANFSDNKIAYQLRLIEEIKIWNQKTNLFGKNISTAALAQIADNLQNFLDEVEKENLDLSNLSIIDDADFASHKQQTLKFLQHFGSVWQNILLKEGLISAAKKRNLMLQNYNQHLQKNGSQFPIIIAGSTGSVFATSELIKTVSSLEFGRIILCGLDKNLEENIWQKINENHPQFMLKKLLEKIEVLKKDVLEIESEKQSCESIVDLSRLIMLPAEFIFGPQKINISKPSNITKIATENEFDEAKIIAFLLRQTLEIKEKNAALISNNKNLISLVKANLLAWKIEVDDSASSNLAESKLANYLFLISEFAANDFSAINLLAILKHSFSQTPICLAELEKKILRDVVKFSGFDDLILKIANSNLPESISEWIKKIKIIFQPLTNEFKKEKTDFRKIVDLHFDCFFSLCYSNSDFHSREGDNPQNLAINEADGLPELLEFYQEISASKTNLALEPQSYNQILQNLLKNYHLRKTGQFHPRLHILSTMEARLMNYDLTIVSNLVEGEFPAKSADDWLGNKIRAEFGLSSQAKKIGIFGYDFCNYLGNKEVVLIHSKNQNNAPTLQSRFLSKLETVLHNQDSWLKNEKKYLELLNFNFQTAIKQTRANPKPQQKLQKISATDISKWLRNPYYIYAKRILKLKPLKKIEQEASFAEFGNFVHKALEEFVKNYPKIDLKNYGKEIFANFFPDKTSHLLWWARFVNIAEWFLKQEIILRKNLQPNLVESFVEIEAEAIIKDVIFSTKIDRINLYQDGSYEIIDYKTGTLPQPKEIKSGLEPQLALEAIILSRGKINNYPQLKISQISNLQYQNLKGKDQNEVKNLNDVDELISAADEGITRLLEIFNHQNHGYICCPNIDIYKEDDYWHLARIGEL